MDFLGEFLHVPSMSVSLLSATRGFGPYAGVEGGSTEGSAREQTDGVFW